MKLTHAITIFMFVFTCVNVCESSCINGSTEDNHVFIAKNIIFEKANNIEFKYWKNGLENPVNIDFGKERSSLNDAWEMEWPLKVIVHGWLTSSKKEIGMFSVKTAYVESNQFNVITVDWSYIAKSKNYFAVAKKTVEVGEILGYLLYNLVQTRLVTRADIHVIGYSLGAHVAGMSGHTFRHLTQQRIGRITGLDPSLPGFQYLSLTNEHLDVTDADFVDIIHTSAGTQGYSKAIGHADFYPNGGRGNQPGCKGNIFVRLHCSHRRSYEYYIESITRRKAFEAVECSSWPTFHKRPALCANNPKSFMGHDALVEKRGKFYLITNKKAPFGLKEEQKPIGLDKKYPLLEDDYDNHGDNKKLEKSVKLEISDCVIF